MFNEKIESTAQVASDAQIAEDVEIGHYAIVGPEVKIGAGTKIGDHCVIIGATTLGKNNQLFTGAVIGSVPQDLKYKGEKTEVIIGDNNIIREYVTINLATAANYKTQVGNNNLIMAYAHIAHDCVIGNNVVMANVGTLAGHITIEDKAILGGLAAVHQFVRIGTMAIVGGCSKVNQDVPPYSMCDGHPAKVRALNKVGLERWGVSREVRSHLKHAFTFLFNSGLTIPNAIKRIEAEIPEIEEIQHLLNFVKSSKRGISR